MRSRAGRTRSAPATPPKEPPACPSLLSGTGRPSSGPRLVAEALGRLGGVRLPRHGRGEPGARVTRMSFAVQTPVFEGPLDLLLHLILRDQVDLYEVSLSDIVDAYLAELEHMEHCNLEVATEF